jgi:hypothetical protein
MQSLLTVRGVPILSWPPRLRPARLLSEANFRRAGGRERAVEKLKTTRSFRITH